MKILFSTPVHKTGSAALAKLTLLSRKLLSSPVGLPVFKKKKKKAFSLVHQMSWLNTSDDGMLFN